MSRNITLYCWVTTVINQYKMPFLKMTQCSHALRRGARTVSFLKQDEGGIALKKVDVTKGVQQSRSNHLSTRASGQNLSSSRFSGESLMRGWLGSRGTPNSFATSCTPSSVSRYHPGGEMMYYIPSILWYSRRQAKSALINSLREIKNLLHTTAYMP